jgi:hypothetical protein
VDAQFYFEKQLFLTLFFHADNALFPFRQYRHLSIFKRHYLPSSLLFPIIRFNSYTMPALFSRRSPLRDADNTSLDIVGSPIVH